MTAAGNHFQGAVSDTISRLSFVDTPIPNMAEPGTMVWFYKRGGVSLPARSIAVSVARTRLVLGDAEAAIVACGFLKKNAENCHSLGRLIASLRSLKPFGGADDAAGDQALDV